MFDRKVLLKYYNMVLACPWACPHRTENRQKIKCLKIFFSEEKSNTFSVTVPRS
jgi:hypothetical protein